MLRINLCLLGLMLCALIMTTQSRLVDGGGISIGIPSNEPTHKPFFVGTPSATTSTTGISTSSADTSAITTKSTISGAETTASSVTEARSTTKLDSTSTKSVSPSTTVTGIVPTSTADSGSVSSNNNNSGAENTNNQNSGSTITNNNIGGGGSAMDDINNIVDVGSTTNVDDASVCFNPGCSAAEWNPKKCKCDCIYKKHKTDPTKYIVQVGIYDFEMPCNADLVWDTRVCSCNKRETPQHPQEVQAMHEMHSSKCQMINDYRLNQTASRYIDFSRLKNFLRNEMFNNLKSKIIVQAVDGASVGGKAALFHGISVTIDALRGNDLTANALFRIRVKPIDGPYENNTQVIMSNGCFHYGLLSTTAEEPSIQLAYNSLHRAFSLVMATTNQSSESSGICRNAMPDNKGWFDLTISVKDSVTTFLVNGEKCLDLQGKGNIKSTGCAMTIGGNPFARDNNNDFHGYMDYLTIYKHCFQEPAP